MIEIIAYLTMFIDHIGLAIYPGEISFRIIGRIAFPLFVYMFVIGIENTKNIKKYKERLWIISIISTIPYYLLISQVNLNICFSFLISAYLLEAIKTKNKNQLLLSILACLLPLEYGTYSILTILIMHSTINKDTNLGILLFSVLTLIFSYNYSLPLQIFSIPAYVAITKIKNPVPYFRNRIIESKLIKYSMYPGHIVLLWFYTILHPL
jgi:hypothetical protein